MKRLRLTILFFFVFTLTFFANDKVGDLNGDGKVTTEDARILMESFLGNTADVDMSIADVNNDGVITMADANAIVNMAVLHNEETITILYTKEGTPVIFNSAPEYVQIESDGNNENDITVTIADTIDTVKPVISISGECSDGRLRVDSDADYTLLLNGINLTSSHAPAFNSTAKGKVHVILADETENSFTDSKKYVFSDTLETANGCFSCYGPIAFYGTGKLKVEGKYSHALYCKKSITINDGNITVNDTKSDAIHSGKNVTINGGYLYLQGMKSDAIDLDDDFTMTGGSIDMNITGDAAKGIKCGGIMNISNGKITATASGALRNTKGELSYCTILKCDSNAVISGGEFNLTNNSPGGKCLSVGRDLSISGGEIDLETHGDGAEYTNADNETDYYTSKCIAVDDFLFIHRGDIQCLSTGIGGKGIVGDKYIEIGMPTDTNIEQGPTINVETANCSIVNDVEEDKRYGCPKAIKASTYLNIYSGDIHCTTAGMGGEGIECGMDFYFYNGNLECNCFDDGINVGEKIEILGGQIYCNSLDNDGIDSNGSIYIKGGVVASVNHNEPNESFDAEQRQFYISGGVIIGIGSNSVKMDTQECLYYNTLYNIDPEKPQRRGLRLTNGKYLYIMDGEKLLLSLKNDNEARRGFVTVTLPEFVEGHTYTIQQGEHSPSNGIQYFQDRLFMGGEIKDCEYITDFQPKYNYND